MDVLFGPTIVPTTIDSPTVNLTSTPPAACRCKATACPVSPMHRSIVPSWVLACAVAASLLQAGDARAGGRLLATGGVTQVEGSAGGGIVPWALIGGTGTRDEIGASAAYTQLETGDFRLRAAGIAIGLYDRVELSYARMTFGLGSTVPGQSIRQDVAGAKVKLFGDAVYDQDTWLPQVAAGVQYKHNRDDLVPALLGARRGSGTDVYVAATKLVLAGVFGRNLLVDGTLRATKANQLGLLGFGGDLNDRYRLRFEGSAALFVTDSVALGGEFRSKPNNLSAFRERAFGDVFAAWLPTKSVAVTAAYTWLGRIADKPGQSGPYVSLQLSR